MQPQPPCTEAKQTEGEYGPSRAPCWGGKIPPALCSFYPSHPTPPHWVSMETLPDRIKSLAQESSSQLCLSDPNPNVLTRDANQWYYKHCDPNTTKPDYLIQGDGCTWVSSTSLCRYLFLQIFFSNYTKNGSTPWRRWPGRISETFKLSARVTMLLWFSIVMCNDRERGHTYKFLFYIHSCPALRTTKPS